MAKELEHIGSITSVGDLPKKMLEAEEAKNTVEAIILKRVSLTVCLFLFHLRHRFF